MVGGVDGGTRGQVRFTGTRAEMAVLLLPTTGLYRFWLTTWALAVGSFAVLGAWKPDALVDGKIKTK